MGMGECIVKGETVDRRGINTTFNGPPVTATLNCCSLVVDSSCLLRARNHVIIQIQVSSGLCPILSASCVGESATGSHAFPSDYKT
jgi:hypothetical protein